METEQAKCPGCTRDVDPDVGECPYCGYALAAPVTPVGVPPPVVPPGEENRWRTARLLGYVVLAIAVILAAVLLIG